MDTPTSKKILILANPLLDIAGLKSSYSLALVLAEKGNSVNIFAGNKNVLVKEIEKTIPNKNISVLNQIEPKKTLLSINKAGSKIKNVLWKEEGEKLVLQIETLNGNFQLTDFDVETQGTKADLIYFIGCKDLQTLSFLYSINPELFTKSETINIDTSNDNTKYAKHNFVKPNCSLAETIAEYLTENSLVNTKQSSQFLLSGILSDTKIFTQKLENSEYLFQTVLSLINSGANYQQALSDYDVLNGKMAMKQVPLQTNIKTTPRVNNNLGLNKPLDTTPLVTQQTVVKNSPALDNLFPKAEKLPPTTSQPQNGNLFTPYSTPPIKKAPVYPQYQGFLPKK